MSGFADQFVDLLKSPHMKLATSCVVEMRSPFWRTYFHGEDELRSLFEKEGFRIVIKLYVPWGQRPGARFIVKRRLS